MSWDLLPFGSQALQTLLYILHPGSVPQGERVFPKEISDYAQTRVGGEEELRTWFVRCVDELLGSDLGLCQLEPNVAVFWEMTWLEEQTIEALNGQVLVVTSGDLEDYYLGEVSQKAHYFRLDFDKNNLGPFFKEALPHIHDKPKGEPRFSLLPLGSGNVVLDFFDFFYRQYFHADWEKWAGDVWGRYRKQNKLPDQEDLFTAIVEAYRTNQWRLLTEERYQQALQEIKASLSSWKDELFPLRLPVELCRTLSYP